MGYRLGGTLGVVVRDWGVSSRERWHGEVRAARVEGVRALGEVLETSPIAALRGQDTYKQVQLGAP